MLNNLIKQLNEEIKKRNTSDAYDISSPKDVDVIHRGYIRNSTYPIKYDFIPKEKAKNKNEGTHVYSFSKENKKGIVSIAYKINSNIESGHETTSIISSELNGMSHGLDLTRTLIPAVEHHIRSHDPDIIKFEKGFKDLNKLIKDIDPESKKYDIFKNKTHKILKKKMPLDDKSKRIISHIQKKLNTSR